MAVGEKRNTWVISQVSWTDWTAQDVYYWLEHSFLYSENINTDDELHGIKLSNRADHTDKYAKCQLISCGEHGVMAIPVTWEVTAENIKIRQFHYKWYYENNKWAETSSTAWVRWMWDYFTYVPWVVFQDKIWYANNYNYQSGWATSSRWIITSININWSNGKMDYIPYDHNDYTDDSIQDPNLDGDWKTLNASMEWNITAMLNYNNTRLVVAAWSDIWVYYPELDGGQQADLGGYVPPQWTNPWFYWVTWWKKVLHFEAWVTIVALTCTFEYLKVWAVDEWWNTKVYYYQGNNNLRSTFVYNLVDLPWERVLHVYSINGTDYFTTSIDGTDWYINLNKMVGTTPVKLFTQRAWLSEYDVNFKAPYFVWPTGIEAAYKSGKIYIADAYWVFQFTYNPTWFDKWYMKWKLRDSTTYKEWEETKFYQIYWVCENQWFLYVSDSLWCRVMRLYDTWVDWYQQEWVLISREFEWKEWGTVTKMLDEIRMNFELNQLAGNNNGTIDVYVSPNNRWEDTDPDSWEDDKWIKVMHIDKNSLGTRTEKSNTFNDLWSNSGSAFKFDWQTITYAIVIKRWSQEKATPIVREIDIKYHSKDKTNNVYDIN